MREKAPMPFSGRSAVKSLYGFPRTLSYDFSSEAVFKALFPSNPSKKANKSLYCALSAATIGTTGTPSSFSNPFISTVFPCFAAMSIMFISKTTGTFIPAKSASINKLRLSCEASAIRATASALPDVMYSRVITSSSELADSP